MTGQFGSIMTDATSTAALDDLMAGDEATRYLRPTSGAYSVFYEPATEFTVGGLHTLRSSADGQATLVGAGVVNDVYSIKPIDAPTLSEVVRDTRGRLVIAEDHRPEGWLGSAVLGALAEAQANPLQRAHLAFRIPQRSGTPRELLAAAVIDATSTDSAAQDLLDDTNRQFDRQDASLPTVQRRSAAPS